jgi:hypothetical protein
MAKTHKLVEISAPSDYIYKIYDENGDLVCEITTDADDPEMWCRLSDERENCVAWFSDDTIDALIWALRDAKKKVKENA